MPGETPDYGRMNAQATIYPVTDLGELAARLGSPLVHNRSGDVLMYETFAGGLVRWAGGLSGTGSVVDLTKEASMSGMLSARLVAGSTAFRFARITRLVAFPVLSGFGLECSFLAVSTIEEFSLGFYVYDGTNQTRYVVRWDDVNNTLDYLDSGGSWVEIADGIDLAGAAGPFHTIKIVAQADAGTYIKALVDATVYDLSGIAGRATANAATPSVDLRAELVGRSGQNDSAYVDNVIATHNEPA